MAEQTQQHAPGGHYSGRNPIPTVKQFVENLDKDKKNRDRQLDNQMAAEKQAKKAESKSKQNPEDGTRDHKMQQRSVKGTEKVVTDPTTGQEVTIADVDKGMMKEVDDPHIVVPNANLEKDTVSLFLAIYGLKLTSSAHQDRPTSIYRRLQV